MVVPLGFFYGRIPRYSSIAASDREALPERNFLYLHIPSVELRNELLRELDR